MRDGKEIRLKPHRLEVIKTGDIMRKYSSGGGGVGDPAERDPKMVQEDVENELVSLEEAEKTYKVILDPKTLEIDQAATDELRSAGVLNR